MSTTQTRSGDSVTSQKGLKDMMRSKWVVILTVLLGTCLSITLLVLAFAGKWPPTNPGDTQTSPYTRQYYIGQSLLVFIQIGAAGLVTWQLIEFKKASKQQAMLSFVSNRAAIQPQNSKRFRQVQENLAEEIRDWVKSDEESAPESLIVAINDFWSFQWSQYIQYLEGQIPDQRLRFYLEFRKMEAQQHMLLKSKPTWQAVYNSLCMQAIRSYGDTGFTAISEMLILQQQDVDACMQKIRRDRAAYWQSQSEDIRALVEFVK